VKGALEMDTLTYLSDEGHWVRALDYAVHAETPETFKKRLAGWLDVFPDVAAIVETLLKAPYADWQEFRRGLQAERDKRFAGEEWAEKYGEVLIPRNAMLATLQAPRFQVPWGAMVIRLAEAEEPS
jgi:hypothetical protein